LKKKSKGGHIRSIESPKGSVQRRESALEKKSAKRWGGKGRIHDIHTNADRNEISHNTGEKKEDPVQEYTLGKEKRLYKNKLFDKMWEGKKAAGPEGVPEPGIPHVKKGGKKTRVSIKGCALNMQRKLEDWGKGVGKNWKPSLGGFGKPLK